MARGSRSDSLRKRVYIVIAIAMTLFFVLITFVHSDLSDDSLLTRAENLWIDAKFKIRGPQLPAGNVVIVGIDERTLKLGSFRTMRHGNYASLVDKLAEAKPSVIGFD